ncbi:MAG TPA: amidohydrolase family protein [Longimicrobium sp.]
MHRIVRTLLAALSLAAGPALAAQQPNVVLLRPDRVFDGEEVHAGWAVLVRDSLIAAAGPAASIAAPADARVIELPGATLMPGMIEGHSHLLLHPYDETSWDDQVLRESQSLRVARATAHARSTLLAGFTTVRDLGSEGAGYADVGLKQAVQQGIIPGPRMLVAGPAIVATGAYGPRVLAPELPSPRGAQEADGAELGRVVREQIGGGADWVKLYADYRWGPTGAARPTFTLDELRLAVEVASSAGAPVVTHASTPEGMRRSVLAGAVTIEHGDGGTPEVFRLMAERGVALCPTLAAGHAVSQYRGWRPGVDPEPARVIAKRRELSRGAGGGGAHLLWQRRGRVRARRQRARTGADGGVRHAAAGRPALRHLRERPRAAPARPRRRASRAAGRPRGRRGRPHARRRRRARRAAGDEGRRGGAGGLSGSRARLVVPPSRMTMHGPEFGAGGPGAPRHAWAATIHIRACPSTAPGC